MVKKTTIELHNDSAHVCNNWHDAYKLLGQRKLKNGTIFFKNGIAKSAIIGSNPNVIKWCKVAPKSINKSISHKDLLAYYRGQIVCSCIKNIKHLAEQKKDATFAVQQLRLAQTLPDPRSIKAFFKEGKRVSKTIEYRLKVFKYGEPNTPLFSRSFGNVTDIDKIKKLTLLASLDYRDDYFVKVFKGNELLFLTIGNKNSKVKEIITDEKLKI